MIKLASLFDGIGGTPLCATLYGAEPVWASEIEEFPIKVTKHHFPKMKHYGDITKINGAEVEPVDIIVGGSPCQDLSVAGQRKGMKHSEMGDEETTRSGLFIEQIRIVKEMRNGTNGLFPRFNIWENVPGAFSSNNGEDFRAVLEETARIADPTISIPRSPTGWANSGSILGDGFSISWRTVDAQYWGVPQRRRRIYLIADFGGESAPEILFESEGLSGYFEKSVSKGQGTAGEIENRIRTAGFIGGSSAAAGTIGYQEEQAPTVKTNANHVVCFEPGAITREMGERSWDELCPTLRAEMGDNQPAICIQGSMIGRADKNEPQGDGINEDVSFTLNTTDRHAVVYENHPNDSRVTGPCDVSPAATQRASGGMYGGGSENVAVSQSTVRRLTPLECERLQGYPDGWTDIPGASDSARYKALGNSFAIPNALFVISGCIAKKDIEEVYKEVLE